MRSQLAATTTLFLLASGAAGTLRAQRCGPDEPVAWRPRAYRGTPFRELRPADRAVVEATLKTVEDLVRKTNYGTPRGALPAPNWGFSMTTDRSQLSSYDMSIYVFLLCNKYDEHGSDIIFVFNPDPQAWSEGDRPTLDEQGDGLYLERERSEPLFGATATYGHFQEMNSEGVFILFTTGGESPTLPVTREEYLRALIFTLEGKNQEKLKEALAATTKTQYQLWVENAPQRRKGNEEILAGVATVDPSKVAQIRADQEKFERETAEALRKSEARERADLDKVAASLPAEGDRLRAQIAAMTPAERASPAFILGYKEFVSPGTPSANAIVRKNPAFFRARTSPYEPRSLLVRLPSAQPEMRARQAQMYRELDWAAVKRLVNP